MLTPSLQANVGETSLCRHFVFFSWYTKGVSLMARPLTVVRTWFVSGNGSLPTYTFSVLSSMRTISSRKCFTALNSCCVRGCPSFLSLSRNNESILSCALNDSRTPNALKSSLNFSVNSSDMTFRNGFPWPLQGKATWLGIANFVPKNIHGFPFKKS